VAKAAPSEGRPPIVAEFAASNTAFCYRRISASSRPQPDGLWRERSLSAGSVELDDPPVHLPLDDLYAATGIAA
jgi:hypothetical protein